MIRLGLAGDAVRPQAQRLSSGVRAECAGVEARTGPVSLGTVQAALQGSFLVGAALAEGGMATLFPLTHAVHGGQMVAKVLHLELARRPEVRAGFLREARHAALLGDHPSAIPVYDLLEKGDLVLLLMPFIAGVDLDRRLASEQVLGRAEALRMMAQICNLLCVAEVHGITHGDISPGNLRCDNSGRYRLMDFGLSYRADEQQNARPLGGTPLYNSPESLRGETPDIRSDLYSLGVVLAEALTGKQLFRAPTLTEIRQKHLEGQWTMPEELKSDRPVYELLRSLLATQREERLCSAFELAGALAAMGFEEEELQAGHPRPGLRAGRRSRMEPIS